MDPSHKSSHRFSRTMKAVLVAFLLIVLSIHESQSYSSGAPPNPALCSSMTPEHHTEPQTSQSPYTIELDKSEVTGGQQVRVTLTSVDKRTPFKGFLLMGQKYKQQRLGSVETPVGKFGFGASPNSNVAQIISCGGQHAVTHKSAQEKNEVVLEWTAPNEDAEYMLVGTFVKAFDTFWVRQPSAKIRVKRDAGVVATEAPKPVAPKLSSATMSKLEDFYSGCTTVKACYGLPNGCVATQDCEMLTTFRVEGSRYVFQVTGQLPEGHSDTGYVASGLSYDAFMGTDSIIGCVLTGNADVEVLSFYSEGSAIKPLQNFTAGLDSASLTGQIVGNRVFCEFSRIPELNIEEIQASFNLGKQDYFVIMASGTGPINDHGFSACPLSLTTNNTSAAKPDLLRDEFYDGCGVTKGCYGIPTYQCVHDKNCELFVSFDKDFNFQLLGTVESDVNSYIAVGLSFDNKMGQDSVIACTYNGGLVEARSYYNVQNAYANNPMPDVSAGIASTKAVGYANGQVFCEFQRTPVLESPDELGVTFDLLNDEYYLLLAKGQLSPEFALQYHYALKFPSPQSVFLSDTINIGEGKQDLLRDEFYDGCGVTKGCYGIPTYQCVHDKNCELFVSFDKDFNFQLLGTIAENAVASYIAVGLSLNENMDQDSVIACVHYDGKVDAKSYYNVPQGRNNLPMPDPNAGIQSKKASGFEDGVLFCEFQRTPLLESPNELGITFDLVNDEYYLLLAKGPLDSEMALRQHVQRESSARSVLLSETVNIGEPGDTDNFYDGCGDTKGCFGFPTYECVRDRNCELFVSFDKDFNFQLLGSVESDVNSYIAVGLSFDNKMGQDSVIACTYNGGLVEARSYYNVPDDYANNPMPAPSAGIASTKAVGYGNGQLFCEFQRTPVLESPDELGVTFDLLNDEYYLLLANGLLSPEFALQQHTLKSPSPQSVLLSETINIGEPANSEKFYDGCGETKGCFGLPTYECIRDRNCELFVSFDKDFNFQLLGTVENNVNSYVAVGLSFDSGMGQDSVIACTYNDGIVEARSYYNVPDYINNPMPDPNAGIASTKTVGYDNGILFCEFQRTPTLDAQAELGVTFDLLLDEYYLLLAKGQLNPDFTLQKHTVRQQSPQSVFLSDTINIGEPVDTTGKFYENCGVSKSCFGLPSYKCIYDKNCELFASFDKDLNFQILGTVESDVDSYIAVGLSFEDKMGQDSVIACVINDGIFEARSYYNVPNGQSNNPMPDSNAGIASTKTVVYENGLILCEFQRTPLLESPAELEATFDLLNDEYHVLLAKGTLNSDFTLQKHALKAASPRSVLLNETINIGEPDGPSDAFYEGCGETKGCWGLPSYECIDERNCEMFVSFDKDFNFQISGNVEGPGNRYLALGLSFDKGMERDSVTGCAYLDGETQVKSYYNIPEGHNSRLMANETAGLASVTTAGYGNGRIYCEFQRTPILESPTEIMATFDLAKDSYYLLLAQGELNSDWAFQKHSETKASSPTSGLLSNIVIIGKPVEYIENFYGGCGETKSCLGLPSYECIYSRDCEMFVSFDSDFNFQMIGKQTIVGDSYVAVGLSFDESMGDDSVVACVYQAESNEIEISSYYNDGHNSLIMTDANAGIVSKGITGYLNGDIYCQFQRAPTLRVDEINQDFDLASDKYYLLVARGQLKDGIVGQHYDKRISSEIVALPGTPLIIGAPVDRSDKFYDNCGITKGCFGLPSFQCILDRDCEMFVSFDKDFNFQIMGTPESAGDRYIALGLSFDASMGTDSVIGCVHKGGEVQVKSYYNVPNGQNNLKMRDELDGVDTRTTTVYENGQIYCEYKRNPVQESPNEIGATFNLDIDKYYFLLAQGGVNSDWSLHQHTASKASSPYAVLLSDSVIVGAPVELIDQFYTGCGETKGCFGIPAFCVSYRNCETLVTFNQNFSFQLAGKLPEGSTMGHVSVGLSFDNEMGQDLVTGCAFTEASNSSVQINSYYNVPNAKNNLIMEDPQDGLISGEGEFTNGTLYCQFTRSPLLNSSSSAAELGDVFDLESNLFYILLAKANEVTARADGVIETLGKHLPEDRAASPESVYLNETSVIGEGIEYSFNEFYEGCTTVKGCFGLPVGCIQETNCDMFASFDKNYKFQVAGKLPDQPGAVGHVSVGLSLDDKMGSDSVVGCVWKDGAVKVKSYYNLQGTKQNAKMTNELAGLVSQAVGSYQDGYVFCEFSRKQDLIDSNNEIGHNIDLLNDKFHILLARASSVPANPLNGEKLGYHVGAGDKGVSAQAVPMTFIGILTAKSPILIELHGAFMVIAWLMCASTGMFTARYYKQTHTDKNPLNKAFWFLLHISCMFATAFMTACGIIFIVVEVGGYSSGLEGPASWHPILGIILTALAGLQVLIAFFRPHPGTPNRPYFNWIHWTIGNSAHIVGIACIFLAQKLSKTGLEDNLGYLGVIVAFVIFHVVMHVVMSIHTVWADKQLDVQNKMRAVRPGPMKPSGKSEEAPGTGFRTFMLILYLAGTAAVAITLVVLVAVSV